MTVKDCEEHGAHKHKTQNQIRDRGLAAAAAAACFAAMLHEHGHTLGESTQIFAGRTSEIFSLLASRDPDRLVPRLDAVFEDEQHMIGAVI